MNYLMLGLRLTHILAGVFWVGATLTTMYYLKQSADLAARRRLTTAMTAAGILNILAGYAMYWIDSNGFNSAWTHSGPGIGFAIGGAFGLLGLILIDKLIRLRTNRVVAIAVQKGAFESNRMQVVQKTIG